MRDVVANTGMVPRALANRLGTHDLSFREFVEWALYDLRDGYYTAASAERHRHSDFVTAPAISPVFGWTIARWFREELQQPAAIVDIGCGDGGLLASLSEHLRPMSPDVELIGIDRSLSFIPRELRTAGGVRFSTSFEAIPSDRTVLVICNELFDALPFARVVERETGLSELCVTSNDGRLDWTERPASADLTSYLEDREVALSIGQFADFTPEWGSLYASIADRVTSGVILTFDYGYPTDKFFDNRVRRFGTAAAYHGHQVHRDLLANPGRQDLTCHVNFDDLIEAGESAGLTTVAFTRLARFLLEAGGAEHPIFSAPVASDIESALHQREDRENARRLLLPDGIGDEMRVLVQKKG